jgi:hypothetical protein
MSASSRRHWRPASSSKQVDDELAEGNSFGARGTPSFFINGKPFHGRAAVRELREESCKTRSSWPTPSCSTGVGSGCLYAELTKDGKDKAEAP